MPANKSVVIIGSGIGGLGSACLLAKAGWNVTVIEKNAQLGGKVGQFKAEGFTFDSGPSWFLMKDVYEHFFKLIGEDLDKHLNLKKLAPSYRVYFKDQGKKIDIHSNHDRDIKALETLEPGIGGMFKEYLAKSAYEYEIAKDRFMYKNYDSVRDFFTREFVSEGRKLHVLSNMDKQVARYFKTPQVRQVFEYPVLFLGSRPDNTPALFGILNHVLFNQGVFYPEGGMYKIVEALVAIAKSHGVKFRLNCPAKKILVTGGKASGVLLEDGARLLADIVVGNTDRHHAETQLLGLRDSTYRPRYWEKKYLAPSMLLIYLGVKGKLPITHHNLVFCKNWQQNFQDIFDAGTWPKDPSFYVSCPSKTDALVAPSGHENMFVLVPVPAGEPPTNKQLEAYAERIMSVMESEMKLPDLHKKIVYKKLFSVKDFSQTYNSYRGSALGLSHSLRQTAAFRPNNVSRKVRNLYFVGADTYPGIGISTTLISAELMYKRLTNNNLTGPLTSLR